MPASSRHVHECPSCHRNWQCKGGTRKLSNIANCRKALSPCPRCQGGMAVKRY